MLIIFLANQSYLSKLYLELRDNKESSKENRFAKEIGLESGFICKDYIFSILMQFQIRLAHLTVWQYCTFLLAFLLIIELLLCSINFEHPKCT